MNDYMPALPDPLAVPALPPGLGAYERRWIAEAQDAEHRIAQLLLVDEANLSALAPAVEWLRQKLPEVRRRMSLAERRQRRYARHQHGSRR